MWGLLHWVVCLTTDVYHLKTVLKENTLWEPVPFLGARGAAGIGTGHGHLSAGAAR